MKFSMYCSKCMIGGTGKVRPQSLMYNDNSVYRFDCENGHRNVIYLCNWKFEILFDIACNGIVDGYFRESVTSFASALERYYEFLLRIGMKKLNQPQDIFDATWKKISSRSEQQLGAYIFVYSALLGKSAPALSSKQASFRNNVVHNGYIPSENEAVAFGEVVLSIIREGITDAKANLSSALDAVRYDHAEIKLEDEADLPHVMAFGWDSAINIGSSVIGRKTMSEALDHIQMHRKIGASIVDFGTGTVIASDSVGRMWTARST